MSKPRLLWEWCDLTQTHRGYLPFQREITLFFARPEENDGSKYGLLGAFISDERETKDRYMDLQTAKDAAEVYLRKWLEINSPANVGEISSKLAIQKEPIANHPKIDDLKREYGEWNAHSGPLPFIVKDNHLYFDGVKIGAATKAEAAMFARIVQLEAHAALLTGERFSDRNHTALQSRIKSEQSRRTYYQTIVYECCNLIDEWKCKAPGHGIVCGTRDEPSTELQDTLRACLGAKGVSAEVIQKTLLVLDKARNGLKWYRDQHPQADSPSDDEMHEEIDEVEAYLKEALQ